MPKALTRQVLAEHLRHPPASMEQKGGEGYVVISIKPNYASLIVDGTKQVEFRRRFPRAFTAGRAIFYISSPTRAIAMVARITAVRRATPKELWREFSEIGGTNRSDFNAYFTGAATGVALILDQIRPLPVSIPLSDPRLRAANFKPPQSLAVLPSESTLPRLVICDGLQELSS
jgi:predicted transcriptional regulator